MKMSVERGFASSQPCKRRRGEDRLEDDGDELFE